MDIDLVAPLPEFPPFLPFEAIPKPDSAPEDRLPLWPQAMLTERELDLLLAKRSMTGVRCILHYYYGRTLDLRWDAFQHLANICTKMALGRNAAWYQRPFVKFIAPPGQPKDPENYDPNYPSLRKKSTRHFFQTSLGEAIAKYSPEHITKQEFIELARMGDARARTRKRLKLEGEELESLEEDDLVNVCLALVRDMINLGQKEDRHELEPDPGFRADVAAPTVEKPDYAGAVQMLVSNLELRQALPRLVSKTLEALFRKLDAGLGAEDAIEAVAQDLKRNEQTVIRNLTEASNIAAGVDGQDLLLNLLADFVLTSPPKDQAAPTPAHRPADKMTYQLPRNLVHLGV